MRFLLGISLVASAAVSAPVFSQEHGACHAPAQDVHSVKAYRFGGLDIVTIIGYKTGTLGNSA